MKKAILISAFFTALALIAGQLSPRLFPQLTDFLRLLFFVGLLIFLPLLFIARPGRISQSPATRKTFRLFR